MKKASLRMNGHSIASYVLYFLMVIVTITACRKNDYHPRNHSEKFSSDVIDKWLTMQLRLMRNATGIPNQALSRHYAYAGIAALESLSPDHAAFKKFSKWNGLTGLPQAQAGFKYYYPANVNAALAQINRAMFPNASQVDKTAIDSLEQALTAEFLTSEDATTVNKSSDFGKAVASAVYNWSETDGYKNSSAAYTPPPGDGMWVPTAPAFASPASPYWGNNRPVVSGSTNQTLPGAPVSFSKNPDSEFYKMAKHVYDVSLTLTTDQKAMAMFWRDVPGATTPGHWVSILQQVIKQTNSNLDKAAFAYALTGAAINDASISCWRGKYTYTLVRPITYIRDVMGHTTWNSYIGTPAHPEYSSGHSVLSGAVAATMQEIFGNIGSFTDHTYDYLGLPARSFSSFEAIAKEAAQSRVYGGIHYQQTVDLGLIEGKKIVANIFSKPTIAD